ncbi:hypothetical protein LGMK_07720 [Leuconostoc sp. C2]|uniref:Uncharacterized protein n=1 Tax=Leuconostoc kimchii (strain IMSNU 11154 / KCTC 2386 / IH25) TaxID=762051 RepID=D5T2I3_LEUKI|nr:hypothetical protein LKI_04700 [Leuconostoc kimchii IMSNU 11154]AEJ31593.1 hypothetical protein LGMK_07720 [Leuconostoc sp. C2]
MKVHCQIPTHLHGNHIVIAVFLRGSGAVDVIM